MTALSEATEQMSTIDQRQRKIRHQINLRRNVNFKGLIQGGKRPDLEYDYYRSSWEGNYARYLSFTETQFEYENRTFWFEKHKSGTVNYTPDFYLPEHNEWHEVKGRWDPKSKTRLRRFKKYFPEEFKRLVVVTSDIWGNSKTAKSIRRFLLCDLSLPREQILSYPEIAKKYSKIIPNWEQ